MQSSVCKFNWIIESGNIVNLFQDKSISTIFGKFKSFNVLIFNLGLYFSIHSLGTSEEVSSFLTCTTTFLNK